MHTGREKRNPLQFLIAIGMCTNKTLSIAEVKKAKQTRAFFLQFAIGQDEVMGKMSSFSAIDGSGHELLIPRKRPYFCLLCTAVLIFSQLGREVLYGAIASKHEFLSFLRPMS